MLTNPLNNPISMAMLSEEGLQRRLEQTFNGTSSKVVINRMEFNFRLSTSRVV